MAFWITIAIMTAVAMLAVLVPLARRGGASPTVASAADSAVYHDQLAELERDAAEGRIAAAEAAAARAEIARRLIAAERRPGAGDAETADHEPAAGGRPASARLPIVAAALVLPVLALGFYLYAGAPRLPGQPLSARAPAAGETDIATLISRIEAHLAANPDDARGWTVVAPVYLRLGRVDDAANAWRNVIRINGSDATSQTGLGQALVAAENGIVTASARRAFEAALESDAGAPLARFYLALARQQEGDTAGAIAGWRALLDDAPPDAPWRAIVADALAGAGAVPRSPIPALPAGDAPGPSAEDMAAAAEMAPEDRQAMIAGMVARLADRLAAEPDDPDGWLRLMRAYMVMGERAAAADAARTAWDALPGEDDRRRIAALAAELGIELGAPSPQ